MIAGIEDREFIRGRVPMTKQEIRILSIAKLRLNENAVVYDVGAGTGSVSVETARQCGKGMVYAIEHNPEGIRLIRANREKFAVSNLEIVEGTAPDCLMALPAPTHAFIGGSGGRLIDIIREIRKKNVQVRFVLNAVTLETIAQLEEVKREFPEYADMEVIQVGISRADTLGHYHLMRAENPVYITAFGGRGRIDE